LSAGNIELYAMQTPQIFSRELLVDAYAAVAEKSLSSTDEFQPSNSWGRKWFSCRTTNSTSR